MTTTSLCSIIIGLTCIVSASQAQTTDSHLSSKPPAGLVIDGHLHEWGDSLKYYNSDKQIGYAVANDPENIYFAVRIGEKSQQERVLANGLTVSINTKGKKKDAYSITFPVGSGNGMTPPPAQPKNDGDSQQDDHEEMMKARLTSLRNIKVTGFKDVESDIITTSNTYGFRTAMTYDDQGYLLYELAVPIKLLEHDDLNKAEWAFNFKVNGFKQPEGDGKDSGMGGMGGHGGGMGGPGGGGGMGRGRMGRGGSGGSMSSMGRSELSKSVDFWDRFRLQH